MIIAFLLELFMLQADLIGVGTLINQLQPIMAANDRGWPTIYVTGELRLDTVFPALEVRGRHVGHTTTAPATVRLALPSGGSNPFMGLFDQQRVWVLRKMASDDVYRPAMPEYPQPPEMVDVVARMLDRLRTGQSWGPVRNGLQAVAIPLTGRTFTAPVSKLAVAVRNVSGRPVYLCTHPKKTRFSLVEAPTGKALPVELYRWLRYARLPDVAEASFLRIEPGELQVLTPRGGGMVPIGELSPAAVTSIKPFRVEIRVAGPAKTPTGQPAWQGTLSTGPIVAEGKTFAIPKGARAPMAAAASAAVRRQPPTPPSSVSTASPQPQPTTAPASTSKVTVLDLLREPQSHHGQKVETTGLVFVGQGVPDRALLLFRFFVECCIAHARPVGVLVQGPVPPDLKDGDWVRVAGRFSAQKQGEPSTFRIEADRIDIIPEPSYNDRYVSFGPIADDMPPPTTRPADPHSHENGTCSQPSCPK